MKRDEELAIAVVNLRREYCRRACFSLVSTY